jgi:hypothetical protein
LTKRILLNKKKMDSGEEGVLYKRIHALKFTLSSMYGNLSSGHVDPKVFNELNDELDQLKEKYRKLTGKSI